MTVGSYCYRDLITFFECLIDTAIFQGHFNGRCLSQDLTFLQFVDGSETKLPKWKKHAFDVASTWSQK